MLPNLAALKRATRATHVDSGQWKVFRTRVELWEKGETEPIVYTTFTPWTFKFPPGASVEWFDGVTPDGPGPYPQPKAAPTLFRSPTARDDAEADKARAEDTSVRERDSPARAPASSWAPLEPFEEDSEEEFDPTNCLRLGFREHCERNDRMRESYFQRHGHYGPYDDDGGPQYRYR